LGYDTNCGRDKNFEKINTTVEHYKNIALNMAESSSSVICQTTGPKPLPK
jgi:hypothetical protein